MQKQQNDAPKSATNTASGLQQPQYGLTFRGIVTSVDEVKEWREFGTDKVNGLQCALGLSDKNRIYTYTLKVETGKAMPELQFMQEIVIENAGCRSDKGQHRLTGNLVL